MLKILNTDSCLFKLKHHFVSSDCPKMSIYTIVLLFVCLIFKNNYRRTGTLQVKRIRDTGSTNNNFFNLEHDGNCLLIKWNNCSEWRFLLFVFCYFWIILKKRKDRETLTSKTCQINKLVGCSFPLGARALTWQFRILFFSSVLLISKYNIKI